MDLYFLLWLIMSACVVALLIVNHRKQKMIDEYKSLVQKCKGCNETDDAGKLKESIESADKLIKEQEETIKDLQRRCRKYIDMMEELKKQAAAFTPMKSMADYTEKIKYFSEQAEDMFGVYIDSVRLKRVNTMFSRMWKVDMKTSGWEKPKKKTE